jgi:hypothetical protein
MVIKASRVLVGRQSAFLLHEIEMVSSGCVRVGKNLGFKKKSSPVGFLGFFGFFYRFFGFFWVFCPDERVFRVFFSFTNTLRCIQILNYNHSY